MKYVITQSKKNTMAIIFIFNLDSASMIEQWFSEKIHSDFLGMRLDALPTLGSFSSDYMREYEICHFRAICLRHLVLRRENPKLSLITCSTTFYRKLVVDILQKTRSPHYDHLLNKLQQLPDEEAETARQIHEDYYRITK